MFQYYNAHPYQLEVDDCVKRAITVTTGMDYMDVQRKNLTPTEIPEATWKTCWDFRGWR